LKGYEIKTKTRPNGSADKYVKAIKLKTRRQFSAEEKIRIVLDKRLFVVRVFGTKGGLN